MLERTRDMGTLVWLASCLFPFSDFSFSPVPSPAMCDFLWQAWPLGKQGAPRHPARPVAGGGNGSTPTTSQLTQFPCAPT